MNCGLVMRILSPACLYLTLGLAMASADPSFAAKLDDHLWRERVLLVFAPAADHPDHVRLSRALEQRKHELDERQFVVYRLFSQGASRSDSKPLEAADVQNLRRRFGLNADRAVLILIGKDGSEKLRTALGEVDLDTIFQLVDEMPMRRQEMRRGQ